MLSVTPVCLIVPAILLVVLTFTKPENSYRDIEKGSKKKWNSCKIDLINKLIKATRQLEKIESKQLKKHRLANKELIQLDYLKKEVFSLNCTLFNLYRLEKSAQEYEIKQIHENGNIHEGGTKYDTSTRRIVFLIGGTANFVHETTHGGQFEIGELAYDSIKGVPRGNDLYDEVAAYQAEFAYDSTAVAILQSSSRPYSFETITPKWVNDLTNPDHSQPYSDTGSAKVGRIHITINSIRDSVLKAYRWNLAWLQELKDSSCTIKTCCHNIKYKQESPGSR